MIQKTLPIPRLHISSSFSLSEGREDGGEGLWTLDNVFLDHAACIFSSFYLSPITLSKLSKTQWFLFCSIVIIIFLITIV